MSFTVASRNVDKLREAALSIERAATGRSPELATCDAGGPDQVAALMARFGEAPLHVLVSAFGGSVRGAFETLTDEQWLANYDFNLLGTVRVVRAALPLLRRAAGGARVVLLLGATSGRQPTALQVATNVRKAGLLALTKTLSLELAPDDIGVNPVSPGRAMTPRAVARAEQMAAAEGVPVEAIHERVTSGIPLRRYGTAEEVAAMVAFLASPVSAYTTGQNVLVDGGLYRGV